MHAGALTTGTGTITPHMVPAKSWVRVKISVSATLESARLTVLFTSSFNFTNSELHPASFD
jgi:hypothetical protein